MHDKTVVILKKVREAYQKVHDKFIEQDDYESAVAVAVAADTE